MISCQLASNLGFLINKNSQIELLGVIEGYALTIFAYRFVPVDRSVNKKPYLPMMLTSSKYGHLKYGTEKFRDESKESELPNGRFKALVPPIQEFCKLNRTYAQ
jgi:hypothetical protein